MVVTTLTISGKETQECMKGSQAEGETHETQAEDDAEADEEEDEEDKEVQAEVDDEDVDA